MKTCCKPPVSANRPTSSKTRTELRAAVERKIAELTEHGSKQARYLGTVLSFLQAQWTGAVVNLKRLFKLFQGDMNWMRNVLKAMT